LGNNIEKGNDSYSFLKQTTLELSIVINERVYLSPLNVKRFDKITIYISITHNSVTLPTLSSFSSSYAKKIRFSLSLKLETLNLQHSSMATSTSGYGMQLDIGSSYLIKPKTMTIPFESFDVQVESPVDFASLKRNGMTWRR